jgi:hypothetical protein
MERRFFMMVMIFRIEGTNTFTFVDVIARSEALICVEARRGNLLYKYLSCYHFKNQIATAQADTQIHAMCFAMTALKVFF